MRTIDGFIETYERCYKKNQRRGQCYMNALFEYDRDEYLRVTGTNLDCFYDDSLIPAFMDNLFHKYNDLLLLGVL